MSLPTVRLPEMIGLTILHSLWQITLLWIVLVAVLRLWPRASSAVRYTFAISILMLSVLTIAATAVYEWQLHATSEEISALPNGTIQTMDIVYITVTPTLLARLVAALNASVPILAWLWCAGLVVMGARFGGSFFYLRTLRARENIAAIPPVWEQELKRLSIALGLKCEVAIARSARISSPLTLGSISPIILVPAGLLSGLSTSQIEAILVHELYHIKRRDYIINICQALVEVLLFYHPAIWHINNIIREERENCCDDQTVAFCGDAIAYARALTRIQEINTFTKPTLAMSATGPNAGNFTNRIKRLFHIYPNPAQARSKGIFAIGLLIVYLCIVLASASVSTARAVEPENEPMKNSISDNNTLSNIFRDSIAVSDHRDVHDGKGIAPQQVAREKIHSMDRQRTDTTVREQSLAHCLKQVNLVLKMASIFGLPGQKFRLPAADSLQLKTPFKFQPGRLHGSWNQSRKTQSDLIDATGHKATTAELIKFKIRKVTPLYIVDGVRIDPNQSQNLLEKIHAGSVNSITVYKGQQAMIYGDEGKDGVIYIRSKPGTVKDIFIPGSGISRGSVRLFAGGMPLQEETDYTVDYTLGKVIINNERILSSGKQISVQYEQSDPDAFQTRSLVGTGVDHHVDEDVNAVQVFPNSTNGHLNISFTPSRKNSHVKIALIDSEGKVVKEITDSTYDNVPTALQVDVSNYKKGIYILRIDIDGIKSQQRVVVE